MDERAMEQMLEAFALLYKADPDFKISGAAHYYPEVEPQMYDLCLSYGGQLPDKVPARRRKEGKITTVYTCCTEAYPNLFTFSAPAEAAWLPWHALAGATTANCAGRKQLDGAPVAGHTLPHLAGDCILYYPTGSSIRMECLIEGVQDVERVRLLREEFARTGQTAKLQELDQAVSTFMPQNLHGPNATERVRQARQTLRRLSGQ